MDFVGIAGLVAALGALLLLLIRPLWGLVALICFYPFHAVTPNLIAVSGFNWPTVLIVVGTLSMFVRYGFILPPLPLLLPIAAFYLVMLLAVGIVFLTWPERLYYPLTKIQMLVRLKMMLWPTTIFFLTYGLASTVEKRQVLMTGLVASAFVAAVVPLFGIEIETPIQEILGISDPRAAGLLRNPNHLGMILSFVSVIPLVRFFDGKVSAQAKLVYAGIYTVYLVSLVLSQSRRAWIAIAASHLAWLWHWNRVLIVPALVGVALLATLGYALLPGLVRERIEMTFTPGQTVYAGGFGLEASASSRVALYRVGTDMFLDSPIIGHGFEGFYFKSPEYGARWGIVKRIGPHSVIMKTLAETGLLGLGVLGWVFGTAFLVSRRLLERTGPDRDLGMYFSGALAAVFVASFFGNVLNHSYVTFFFWTTFALAARARFQVPEGVAELERPMGLVPQLLASRA